MGEVNETGGISAAIEANKIFEPIEAIAATEITDAKSMFMFSHLLVQVRTRIMLVRVVASAAQRRRANAHLSHRHFSVRRSRRSPSLGGMLGQL